MSYPTLQRDAEARSHELGALPPVNADMGPSAEEHGKERLMAELRAIASDLQVLIEHGKSLTQAEFEVARQKFVEGLATAKLQSIRLRGQVRDAGTKTAQYTDDYVRGHPWHATGLALSIGVLLGLLIARR